MDEKWNKIRSPGLFDHRGLPWELLSAREQKRRIQGSRFPLEPLLGSILKAHDGLDGFPEGFGRGLERTLLKKLIF